MRTNSVSKPSTAATGNSQPSLDPVPGHTAVSLPVSSTITGITVPTNGRTMIASDARPAKISSRATMRVLLAGTGQSLQRLAGLRPQLAQCPEVNPGIGGERVEEAVG